MINIVRPVNEPAELTHQRGLAVGTYNTEPIRINIATTFLDKCYLCEKDSTNFNIEHLISHRGNRDLKFRWGNLFYCCRNCNSIKSTTYDEILNCCDFNVIITNEIKFEVDTNDIENVIVRVSSTNPSIQISRTLELLNICYEGTTYDTKNVAFATKIELLRELNKLKEMICEFIQYENLGNVDRAQDKKDDIQRELQKRKPFLAFKISLIERSARLRAAFSDILPVFP